MKLSEAERRIFSNMDHWTRIPLVEVGPVSSLALGPYLDQRWLFYWALVHTFRWYFLTKMRFNEMPFECLQQNGSHFVSFYSSSWYHVHIILMGVCKLTNNCCLHSAANFNNALICKKGQLRKICLNQIICVRTTYPLQLYMGTLSSSQSMYTCVYTWVKTKYLKGSRHRNATKPPETFICPKYYSESHSSLYLASLMPCLANLEQSRARPSANSDVNVELIYLITQIQ